MLIDKTARIDPSAQISRFAFVGHGARIERGATLEADTTLHAGATVGRGAIVSKGATVGRGATILAGACVPPGIVIGDGHVWPTQSAFPLDSWRIFEMFCAAQGIAQEIAERRVSPAIVRDAQKLVKRELDDTSSPLLMRTHLAELGALCAREIAAIKAQFSPAEWARHVAAAEAQFAEEARA